MLTRSGSSWSEANVNYFLSQSTSQRMFSHVMLPFTPDPFLAKSFDVEQLLATVVRLLSAPAHGA